MAKKSKDGEPERVVKPGQMAADDKSGRTEVRIVAGSLRGRKVTCFVHPGLRPTPQLVREALFSILGNAVPGRVFYDIFAGTGVVGLEAISRGATRANLIEFDSKQAMEIQKHIERFGIADKAFMLRADAYRWAERWVTPLEGQPINLFLSPPFPDITPDRVGPFMKMVIDLIAKAPLESVITLQTEEEFPFAELPEPAAWDIRKYGRNYLAFYVKEAPAEAVKEGEEFNHE
ncbi:MAG: RsmD family RNA methyltransferase [Fimbriiglobus sp.]